WSRLIRFAAQDGRIYHGQPVVDQLGRFPQALGGLEAYVVEGDIFGANSVTNTLLKVEKLLAPLERVPIFLGIGLNYASHAAELKTAPPPQPVLFTKPPGALQHPFEPIVVPRVCADAEADYEAELAVVIGKRCKNVNAHEALHYVAGYTCANDVTARYWQRQVGQWTFSKSFDTFCPLGPVITSTALIPDPNALGISLRLNGELMQNSSTKDMIYPVASLVSFLSQGTTLEPGTVILTGTPPGVGTGKDPKLVLKHDDRCEVEIESIGTLVNPVVYGADEPSVEWRTLP
ncbi:5-carboxymethyl-2-hydroxymuconate delta-isomerase, partial [Polychytrium aggregatum]|uniref:5-carboxymethyl-2-hydroxymuconate delta-isomerase n=1 Tax=Polychytrium aggregatum TaxID=110093 RepID=UPI0022FDF7FB